MRAIRLCPAGTSVELFFDDSLEESLVADVLSSWAAMDPVRCVGDLEQSTADGKVFVSAELSCPEKYRGVEGLQFLSVQHVDAAQERLTVEVTLAMLRTLAGSVSLFHAAALGDESSGRAMILIGPSGRGKTTASRFLGQHFAYLSDETAVVQDDLYVRPYPKPLSVIVEKGSPKHQIDPGSLGISVVAPDNFSYQLSRIVLLGRVEEPTVPYVEDVSWAEALVEIAGQTSGLLLTDDGLPRLLDAMKRCGGVRRVVYSEISQTLPVFRELLSSPAEESSASWQIVHSVEQEVPAGLVSRVSGTSAVLLDDASLIYGGGRLSEVSEFAADSWLLLDEPLPVDVFRQRIEQQYGPIPDDQFPAVLQNLVDSQMISYQKP
ncbi:hypothetical protein [Rothia sp. CCM 9419]|uniref:hypothetical protein n=1 Tax=Rothia sp. CCM 9419 TaxID=3402662 RepID=UPI003ADED33A